MFCFFFKQKTAYEMRISDWSSDVCSSDLFLGAAAKLVQIARTIGPCQADADRAFFIAEDRVERVLRCRGQRYRAIADVALRIGVGVVEVDKEAVKRGWQEGERLLIAELQPLYGRLVAVQRDQRLGERHAVEHDRKSTRLTS